MRCRHSKYRCRSEWWAGGRWMFSWKRAVNFVRSDSKRFFAVHSWFNGSWICELPNFVFASTCWAVSIQFSKCKLFAETIRSPFAMFNHILTMADDWFTVQRAQLMHSFDFCKQNTTLQYISFEWQFVRDQQENRSTLFDIHRRWLRYAATDVGEQRVFLKI